MAQGGDPTGTGTGGSDLPNIRAEFTREARFLRGTCGMARAQDPHSANSQFYIMFAPSPHLDGQYTIWGQVTEGMEAIDKIKRGAGGSGMVSDPDRIISMKMANEA
jgi:cyclophilin family peptidyl-prolyl cis-trans isomerase